VNPPRVAFFTDSFHEVNGVALTSREFARFAAGQGYPFFSAHAGPETRHSKDGEFETAEIAHSPWMLGLERDLSFDLLFFRHRARLRRQLQAFRPDLVDVTGPSHIGMLGAILAFDLKVPLVASWHTNLHEFAARRLERKLTWLPARSRAWCVEHAERGALYWTVRFYRLAKLLFAPNPELVRMLSVGTRRPTHLMQRGIDTNLFSPARRTRGGDEFVIGFVGRLSPEKNVRLLADLERSLHEAGIRDCRFLIVGDGSERAWLERNLERATLPGVLSGEALAEAYANMDVFVFPSETDTFGNVILEAMASGVPAVVTGGGGPKFLVRPNRNGYIAGGLQAFTQAAANLWSNAPLRNRMAKAARADAMTRSWDNVFAGVYGRYDELLLNAKADQQVQDESEDSRAEEHGNRQREHPGEQKVAQSFHLQAGMVGRHGAGDSG
jgi:phosphatidylinositol alpha 1,6-mannosyltransferase